MDFKHITSLLGTSIFFLCNCTTQNEGIEVTGRLSIKGTTPHHYIALHDKKHQKIYKILNTKAYDISKYQNRILTLQLKVIKEERGIGFPTEVEVLSIQR